MNGDIKYIAALMALGEYGDEKDTLMWYQHFYGHAKDWKNEEHSGDCTKQPWTCVRCVYDDTVARIPGFKALLKELEKNNE